MPRKNNYVPSIIQTGEAKCYLCGRMTGLEMHHVLHGRGIRKLADEDGLKVWLCYEHHRLLHDQGDHDKELQALGQKAYIKARMKEGYPEDVARERFRARYGRFYTGE